MFNTPADGLVTGILDQAIRSSFNFITREARAEAGVRVGPRYSLVGRYSYEHTRLFDERFTEAEKPLIDRIVPAGADVEVFRRRSFATRATT